MENEIALRQEVRKVQLNILTKLDEVCKKYNLRYYLAFGTCLGALRHKGFIPWDDDIDVLMPFADAKRLIDLQAEFGTRYFVQSRETDWDYRSISMRIRDCETTCIEGDEVGLKTCKGIYVDIYPYYECSPDKPGQIIHILQSHLLKVLVNNRAPINHGKLLANVSRLILGMYSSDKRKRKIEQLQKKLVDVRGAEILDYFGQDITLLTAISYPKEWFAEPKELEFEGKLFYGPTEPEKYLKKRYGDYMKLPPIEDQVVHHTYVVIDPFRSYTEYEKAEIISGGAFCLSKVICCGYSSQMMEVAA